MRVTKEFVLQSRGSTETYIFGHWPVDKATEILAWLSVSLGPSVKGSVRAMAGKDLLDLELKDIGLQQGIEIFDLVISNLGRSVSPEEYSQRMKQIFDGDILCNGKPVQYQTHFAGRQKALHRVALEVLKYQFADFLEDLPSTSEDLGRTGATSLHSNLARSM